MRVVAMAVVLWIATANSLAAQERTILTECVAPAGHSYELFPEGMEVLGVSGFREDAITGGRIRLERVTGPGGIGYEISAQDAVGFSNVRENDGTPFLVRESVGAKTILVTYPNASELYTFVLDGEGTGTMMWSMHKATIVNERAWLFQATCERPGVSRGSDGDLAPLRF